jgi:pimeloyl-ACP methyl ester carboxylesterase
MATFVLVHGAWRGGWVWDSVREMLQNAGHTVYAPTLTGLAERRHLLTSGITLDTHIQDIVSLMEFEDLQDVVLCGHSAGGMVITGVADRIPKRIFSIVYLDAFVPNDGDSVFTLSSDAFQLFEITAAAQLGGIACAPMPTADFGMKQHMREWFERKCTPHPIAALMQGIKLSNRHLTINTRMFVFAQWNTTYPSPFACFYDRLKDNPSWVVRTVTSGHDVMIDEPETIVKILAEAAIEKRDSSPH